MKVITNDKLKKDFKPSCTVMLDNEALKFDEFVAIGFDEKIGKAVMRSHADAVTLGMATILIAKVYAEAMAQLSPEDQAAVLEVLKQ